MKQSTLLLLLIINQVLFSQTELKIFSEKGDAFTLIVDGEKMNATPLYKIEGIYLKKGKHQIKTIFQDFTVKDADLKVKFNEEGTYTYKVMNENGISKIELLNFRAEKIESVVSQGMFKGYSKQQLKDYILKESSNSHLLYTQKGQKFDRNYILLFLDNDQISFSISEQNTTDGITTFEFVTEPVQLSDLILNPIQSSVYGETKKDVKTATIVNIEFRLTQKGGFKEKNKKGLSDVMTWVLGTNSNLNIQEKQEKLIQAFRDLIKLSKY